MRQIMIDGERSGDEILEGTVAEMVMSAVVVPSQR